MDVSTFLKENGLDVEEIDRAALLASFIEEMDAGLAGKHSSLMMIPSFITIDKSVKTDKPVVVLDAGGTNLRAAVVTIDASGNASIGSFFKRPMPGTREELSAEAFYEAFADFLMPIIATSDTIGFCFSYPAEITPDCDAKLIYWTKQIKVPAVVGTLIGSGLQEQLAKRGFKRKAIILNDPSRPCWLARARAWQKRTAHMWGSSLGQGRIRRMWSRMHASPSAAI